VLGEYAYLKGADAIAEVCDQICEVAERTHSTNSATRAYAITAVIKLTAQYGRATTSSTALVLKYANSANSDLQQRCYEFMELSKMPHMMREVLPVDASYEDLEIDANLSFLDGLVQAARDKGMPEYSAPQNDEDDFGIESKEMGGLNFEAYATPTVGSAAVVNGGLIAGMSSVDLTSDGSSGGMEGGGGADASNGGSSNDMFSSLKVTKNVWGSSGFTGKAAGMNVSSASGGNGMSSEDTMSADFGAANSSSFEPIEASIVPGAQSNSNTSSNDIFSTSENVTKSYEPEPDPEPVISQREQEAMALFGGISATTGGASTGSKGRARNRRARQNRSEPKQEDTSQQSSSQAETQQSTSSGGTDDLLDLMGGMSEPSSSVSAPVGGGNDSMNMFADLGSNTGSNSGTTNSENSGGLFDMGDLMGGMDVSLPVQQQQPNIVPGGLGSTQEFGQLWVSPANSPELTSKVGSFNIRTPEAFMQCMSTKANLQGIQAISQSTSLGLSTFSRILRFLFSIISFLDCLPHFSFLVSFVTFLVFIYNLLISFLSAAEAICAGRDSTTNTIVLVHGQISPDGQISVKVRSQDAGLSERCLQIAMQALN
jgi:AP-4 complex subunit epsilon-1